MVHHGNYVMRHYHKRKGKKEKNKLKRAIDRLIYIVVFVGPVMTLPQVYKIWVEKNASGVSAVSWISYFIMSIFWFFYGVVHKEKPIIVGSSIMSVLQITIFIGVLVYG